MFCRFSSSLVVEYVDSLLVNVFNLFYESYKCIIHLRCHDGKILCIRLTQSHQRMQSNFLQEFINLYANYRILISDYEIAIHFVQYQSVAHYKNEVYLTLTNII